MIKKEMPYSHESITQYLKQLQESEGWKIIGIAIETKMEMMEEKMWSESALTESQMLRMRDEYRVLSDLLQQPQRLIELYSPKIELPDQEIYD